MNCHKLVKFKEFLSPGEHISAQVSWTYASTIHGHKMSVVGGTSDCPLHCQLHASDMIHDCKCQVDLL